MTTHSDFWSTSTGENAGMTGTEYTVSSDPIPHDTTCTAAIDEAVWASPSEYTQDNDDHIHVRWNVLEPAAYANRKVFQKIRVRNIDPKKSDKAKRMLAAIDANAGGKLVKLGREPVDQDLMTALVGKIMRIKVLVWDMDGKKGNWVAAVGARNGNVKPASAHVAAVPTPGAAPASKNDASFDDIPF